MPVSENVSRPDKQHAAGPRLSTVQGYFARLRGYEISAAQNKTARW